MHRQREVSRLPDANCGKDPAQRLAPANAAKAPAREPSAERTASRRRSCSSPMLADRFSVVEPNEMGARWDLDQLRMRGLVSKHPMICPQGGLMIGPGGASAQQERVAGHAEHTRSGVGTRCRYGRTRFKSIVAICAADIFNDPLPQRPPRWSEPPRHLRETLSPTLSICRLRRLEYRSRNEGKQRSGAIYPGCP